MTSYLKNMHGYLIYYFFGGEGGFLLSILHKDTDKMFEYKINYNICYLKLTLLSISANNNNYYCKC